MHPKDLGCCLLKEWTGLRDAFVETEDFKVRDCFPLTPTTRCSVPVSQHPSHVFPQGSEDGCTMVPKNCYVSQQDLGPFPFGVRIDYVLYKVRKALLPSMLFSSLFPRLGVSMLIF